MNPIVPRWLRQLWYYVTNIYLTRDRSAVDVAVSSNANLLHLCRFCVKPIEDCTLRETAENLKTFIDPFDQANYESTMR